MGGNRAAGQGVMDFLHRDRLAHEGKDFLQNGIVHLAGFGYKDMAGADPAPLQTLFHILLIDIFDIAAILLIDAELAGFSESRLAPSAETAEQRPPFHMNWRVSRTKLV